MLMLFLEREGGEGNRSWRKALTSLKLGTQEISLKSQIN
jgi:hypothetical protein